MTTRRHFIAGSSAAILAGAAPRLAWGRTEADVIIIGAGLAGLHAAKLCEAAGLNVTVLEAENRIGGRLHTLDDLPGKPEAGGIQIGAGYTRLHNIANELGVGLSSDAGAGAGRVQSPGNLYWVNGANAVAADWAESPRNMLSAEERGIEPASLLRFYARALPSLSEPEGWLEAPDDTDISVAQSLRNAGASEEALQLIEANFNGNSLAGMSQIHLARSFAIFRSQPGPISTVVGGSQRLPEAMAASLKADIRLGTRVRWIDAHSSGVDLTLEPTGEVLSARQVICTIPFSAISAAMVQAPLSAQMAFSMAQLPYTRASFAFLSAKEPFWQDDPFPDTLWTDDPLIGRVFVLSDGSGDGPPMLKLWTTGAGADLLDRLPRDVAAAQIIARIETMRPSSKGKLTLEQFFSWQRVQGARGIYHHIGTGMARNHAMACLDEGTQLHFAGEHLAIQNSGMEGALESGERAANRVIRLS
jgi:monoamine oxidase